MSPPAPHLTLLVGALFLFAALACSGPDAPPVAPAGKALAAPGPPTGLTNVESNYHGDLGALLVTVQWTKPAEGVRFFNDYDAQYQYSFGTNAGKWTTFQMAKSMGANRETIVAHFTIDHPVRNTDVKWRVRSSTDAGQSEWVEAIFSIPDNPYRTGTNPAKPGEGLKSTPRREDMVLETIWTATLTVGDVYGNGSEVGCQNSANSIVQCDDHLTDGEFSYGPTYYIRGIRWRPLDYQRQLSIGFLTTTNLTNSFKNALVLTVGSRELPGTDAHLSGITALNDLFRWNLQDDPLQGFEVGDRVRLSLKARQYKSSGSEKYPSNDPPTQRLTGPDAPPPEPVLFPNQKDCKIPCKETQSHGVRFIEFTNADEDTERQRKHNYYAEHYGDDWMTTCGQTRCGSILMLDGTITKLQ